MEWQAFALLARGDSAAAALLLTSPAYDLQKQLSVDATSKIAAELGVGAAGALDFQRKRGSTVMIAVTVAVLLLVFTWIISLRISAGLIARRQMEEIDRAEQARRSSFVADVRESLTKADSLTGILQSCASAMVQHRDPVLPRISLLHDQTNTLC